MSYDSYLTRLYEARADAAEDCPDCRGHGCDECDDLGVIDGRVTDDIDREIAECAQFWAVIWE